MFDRVMDWLAAEDLMTIDIGRNISIIPFHHCQLGNLEQARK